MQSSDKIPTDPPLDAKFGQKFPGRPSEKFGQIFSDYHFWYLTYQPIIQGPGATCSRFMVDNDRNAGEVDGGLLVLEKEATALSRFGGRCSPTSTYSITEWLYYL